ncbi:MAG: hypothetical protein IT376_03945 [Polyangiaceae bacterium]|nr:hypothetical protein [Polyangiaceae bacterium]
MKFQIKTFATLATTSLLLGAFAAGCGGTTPGAEDPAGSAAGAKDCCKGKNDCKGKGSCKVEGKNDCSGKNECKGMGGCNAHCPT